VKVGHRQALIPQTPGAISLPGGSALLNPASSVET